MSVISGFSKYNLKQRLDFIVDHSDLNDSEALSFDDYRSPDENQQRLLSEMIENYIGNFPLPMGVVTNMIINGESFIVPFVTEESSVVAAASKAAKYWAERGGFNARIDSTTKKGQVHFTWNGEPGLILHLFPGIKQQLLAETDQLTGKMRKRGGGITEIELVDKRIELSDYYQIDVSFETGDAMGANFINSCLEKIASVLTNLKELNFSEYRVDIIMSILSNYTPDCKVNCWVECPVEKLNGWSKYLETKIFANKFKQSVEIANMDISRAVTHNKGIFNGVDAVLLATGNDYRATAAAAHAYASRDGKYKGLTTVTLTDQTFRYELEIPLALGTVGGITQIHPTVKNVMAILKNPDASKLMMIAAASGLANNFSAVASLITTGIQSGHMKMHLSNILNQFNTSDIERNIANEYFSERTVSHSAVEDFLHSLRKKEELR